MNRVVHAPVPLCGRPEAEAHVGMTCFKLGPPGLFDTEPELLVRHREKPGTRSALAEPAEALGEHAPHSTSPLSPALPLPGGSVVTVEPGGQVERSSSPYPDATNLCPALATDLEVLGDRPVPRPAARRSRPAAPPACWACGRLPTEVERGKAARHDPAAGRSRLRGDDDPSDAHSDLGRRHLRPAPVGAHPAGASVPRSRLHLLRIDGDPAWRHVPDHSLVTARPGPVAIDPLDP